MTLMKVTEEDTSKWIDILCSQIGRINIVKKLRLDVIFIKIPITFFIEIEQTVQFVWTHNSQSSNKKERQSQRHQAL